MKTIFARKEDVKRKWFLVNAEDKVLGRLASRVASILRGKTNPLYTPHVDTGDYVVIINAEKIRLTGNKLQDKNYIHHSGYPGGLKKKSLKVILHDKPEQVIISAVKGMLPKNTLGRSQLKKLKVYTGPEHPHKAHKPEAIEIIA